MGMYPGMGMGIGMGMGYPYGMMAGNPYTYTGMVSVIVDLVNMLNLRCSMGRDIEGLRETFDRCQPYSTAGCKI